MFSTKIILIPNIMDLIINIINEKLPQKTKITNQLASFSTILILTKELLYKHKNIPVISKNWTLLNNTHTTIIPYYDPELYATNLCFYYSHYLLDLFFGPQRETHTTAVAITKIVLEKTNISEIYHYPDSPNCQIEQPEQEIKNFIALYYKNFKEITSKIKNEINIEENSAFYEIPTKKIFEKYSKTQKEKIEKAKKEIQNNIKKEIRNNLKKLKKEKKNEK